MMFRIRPCGVKSLGVHLRSLPSTTKVRGSCLSGVLRQMLMVLNEAVLESGSGSGRFRLFDSLIHWKIKTQHAHSSNRSRVFSPMMYEAAKFLHVTGVVMLMGNISVTAIWKFFADRSGQPEVLGFAQKLVTYTDWSMTMWGAVLIMVGGYFMAIYAGFPLWDGWMLWSQIFFAISGSIWLAVLVPIQIKQSRLARDFSVHGVCDEYRSLSRRWLIWGVISTLPLIAAVWLMLAKPF